MKPFSFTFAILSMSLMLFAPGFNAQAQEVVGSELRIEQSLKNPPQKVFYNFDEVDILGNIKKPLGSSLLQSPEIRFKQLLNLDESFIPKVIDATDEY